MVQSQNRSNRPALINSRRGDAMGTNPNKVKAQIGVGWVGIKAIAKALRKQYGPMLKRLAGQ